MASKYAKRAAMRTKYTAPVSRVVQTYANQTLGNWSKQIDPLTQTSIDSMTQQIQIDAGTPTQIIDLKGQGGNLADEGDARGGGFDLGEIPVKGGGGVTNGGGTVVVGPGGGTETVSQCHTHTMADWTGLGNQYLNGSTSQAIGTNDGHTHLVIAGNVQPVSSFIFPDVPAHTHNSLTEI